MERPFQKYLSSLFPNLHKYKMPRSPVLHLQPKHHREKVSIRQLKFELLFQICPSYLFHNHHHLILNYAYARDTSLTKNSEKTMRRKVSWKHLNSSSKSYQPSLLQSNHVLFCVLTYFIIILRVECDDANYECIHDLKMFSSSKELCCFLPPNLDFACVTSHASMGFYIQTYSHALIDKAFDREIWLIIQWKYGRHREWK